MPKTWATNRTTQPSNSAVPDMFIVVPSGSTKPATGARTPRSSRAAASAVGRVAALELVEKAVTSTGRISLNVSMGLRRARNRSQIDIVPNRCSSMTRMQPADEQAERDHDVPADLHHDAVDHGRHRVGREPEREVHDAGHEVVDEAESRPELLAPVLAQLDRGGADEDREQDQRQHVAEAVAVVADEGAEQVPRHEHLDDRHRRHVRLSRALRDVLGGRAAVLLEELGPGLGRQRSAGLDHVHHDEAERHGDRHVQEEQHEGAHRERTERREVLELGDAHGERREDERDDHEEQHPQEDLPDRVEHERRELAGACEEVRREVADEQRDAARQRADHEADQDPVGKPGARVRRHVVVPRHRPAPAMVTSGAAMKLLLLIATAILAGCSTIGPAAEQLYPAHAVSDERVPVILIPGLLGSRLARAGDDTEAWPGGTRKLLTSDYAELALRIDPETLEPVDDGLVPSGIFEGAAGRDFYRRLMRELHQAGGYRQMSTGRPVVQQRARLYVFTYDWRQDIVKTVGKLDELIEQIRRDYRRPSPARRRRRAQHGRARRALLRALRHGGRAGRQLVSGHRARPLEAAPRRAARHAEPGHRHRRPQVPERVPRGAFRAADRGRRDHAVHLPALSASAGGMGRQHQRQAARLRRLRRGFLAPLSNGRSSTTASSAAWTAAATSGRRRTSSSAGSRSASSAAAASHGR